jgi:hypothetical protein
MQKKKKKYCCFIDGEQGYISYTSMQQDAEICNIVTYKAVRATKMTGSSSDDCIYWHFRLQPLLITIKYRQYSAIADLHTL